MVIMPKVTTRKKKLFIENAVKELFFSTDIFLSGIQETLQAPSR
jgi:hypothetical protein